MRMAGLIEVPDGLDFGVIWPLYQAAKVVHTRDIREWVLDFFNDWPLELVLVTTLLVSVFNERFRTRSSRKSTWQ